MRHSPPWKTRPNRPGSTGRKDHRLTSSSAVFGTFVSLCFLSQLSGCPKGQRRLTRLATAPATARSGFPLTLLICPVVCTLGNPLAPTPNACAPPPPAPPPPPPKALLWTALFTLDMEPPVALVPVTVDCRFTYDVVVLLGEETLDEEASRVRIALAALAAENLIAVAGGSGRGRMLPWDEGAWALAMRLTGEFVFDVAVAC